MTEKWLPSTDYDNVMVSDRGRVIGPRGGILKAFPNQNGRLRVWMHRNGTRRAVQVSHLVLTTFVGPRPSGMDALHWDDDVTNNRLGNLRWDTPSANRFDCIRNGSDYWTSRDRCANGHEYQDDSPMRSDNRGRRCLKCEADKSKRYRARKAAA
jgi:HNH endonuclease